MRKIFAVFLAVMMVVGMTIQANAVTPSLGPKLPKIPDTSDTAKVELPDSFWENWLRKYHIRIDWSKVFGNTKVG